jgi:hypothetical protein
MRQVIPPRRYFSLVQAAHRIGEGFRGEDKLNRIIGALTATVQDLVREIASNDVPEETPVYFRTHVVHQGVEMYLDFDVFDGDAYAKHIWSGATDLIDLVCDGDEPEWISEAIAAALAMPERRPA